MIIKYVDGNLNNLISIDIFIKITNAMSNRNNSHKVLKFNHVNHRRKEMNKLACFI